MVDEKLTYAQTLELRKRYVASSCSLFYKDEPLRIVRARNQYMYDDEGHQYLDCVNNVAHVGHCHPNVVAAECQQAATLNTNSRFLHENIALCAQKLCTLLPDPLNVCFFVNSGSEANDLALQLAKCHAKRDHIITVDHAYHGHLESALALSPYKFTHRKLFRKPDWVHVAPSPDAYRGLYRSDQYTDDEIGPLYAKEVHKIIAQNEGKIAGFIVESLQSCAGQVFLPKNYLRDVYKYVRQSGGVCIADEVQVGFGRVGTHWWAFQMQGEDVVPDIVTLGKPMGNGHPVSAVVTTREIAASFYAETEEWFSTFGGNPVSCAIAMAVIKTIERENLMEHAHEVGKHIVKLLLELKSKYTLIGDIRGVGLFVGIELVKDRQTKEPATEEAKIIAGKLKAEYIIVSRDGPHENVLKLKPPMVFDKSNAELFASKLDKVLSELSK